MVRGAKLELDNRERNVMEGMKGEQSSGLSLIFLFQSQPRVLTLISIPKYFPSLAGYHILMDAYLRWFRLVRPSFEVQKFLPFWCPPVPPVLFWSISGALSALPLISTAHLSHPLLNANEQRKFTITRSPLSASCSYRASMWTEPPQGRSHQAHL